VYGLSYPGTYLCRNPPQKVAALNISGIYLASAMNMFISAEYDTWQQVILFCILRVIYCGQQQAHVFETKVVLFYIFLFLIFLYGNLFSDTKFSVNSSFPHFTLKYAGYPRISRTRSIGVRDQSFIFHNSSSFGLSVRLFFYPSLPFFSPSFPFPSFPSFVNSVFHLAINL